MATQQNTAPRNTKYPNDSDQTAWIMRTKDGDRRTFNNIVNKYQQPIYNYCYRMLQNRDEAEDAAQEVFLRAYARLGTYDDRHKFSTWLFSIAAHYCIDKLRKRRFQLVSWDDLAPRYLFPGQESPQPERALLEAEAAREVWGLLNMLPPDYRTMIILKYWHALSYQEIAQTLETTVSAVKSKLFRARKMMATQIATAQAVTPRPGTAPVSSRVVYNSSPMSNLQITPRIPRSGYDTNTILRLCYRCKRQLMMNDVKQKLTLDQPATYQIKVPGHLDESWSEWAGGMTIMVENGDAGPSVTILTGVVVDQAALQSLLRWLYSLGLSLISVNRVERGRKDEISKL